jgi:glycosyltransferase involved in cell wall biosynthesis
MRIWLLEPYFTGSHQAWAVGFARHSQHQVDLLTMAGRFWKWRMHGGALELAAQVHQRLEAGAAPDLLLASDMVNLPALLALVRPALSATPIVYYAHENQLTYPLPARGARDLSYALINLLSMAAASRVCFNSRFHLESWFEELPRLLKHFPDYNHLAVVGRLAARSQVLPLGLDLARFDARRPPRLTRAAPIILWNQRWEYDKNPAAFFAALDRLLAEGFEFQVALLGENFRRAPQEFSRAHERLGDRLLTSGFAADPADYAYWLWQADIVVSTAWHEFFGAAIVEAIYCGCWPLLPRRLAYPEIVPPAWHAACLYDDDADLLQHLRRLLSQPELLPAPADLRASVTRFDWRELAPVYDQLMTSVAVDFPR